MTEPIFWLKLLETRDSRPTCSHRLTGLVYCADCGGKLFAHKVGGHFYLTCYTCSRRPSSICAPATPSGRIGWNRRSAINCRHWRMVQLIAHLCAGALAADNERQHTRASGRDRLTAFDKTKKPAVGLRT